MASLTTTNSRESKVVPGVIFHLRKMTEGRRIELRKSLMSTNSRIRQIGREQDAILSNKENPDMPKFLELNDEFDSLMIEEVNPKTLLWGIKSVEGLEIDGKILTIAEWSEFPSELFHEMIQAINVESGLSKDEEKNLPLPTTSGAQVGKNPESSTASNAKSGDITRLEIVGSSSLN
jgi:hypothetical protein